jgi:hypothetical protein
MSWLCWSEARGQAVHASWAISSYDRSMKTAPTVPAQPNPVAPAAGPGPGRVAPLPPGRRRRQQCYPLTTAALLERTVLARVGGERPRIELAVVRLAPSEARPVEA